MAVSETELRNSKRPVYVKLEIDGRQYVGEVRGLKREYPYVSVTTGTGSFRIEFTARAILHALNNKEALLG